MPTKKTTKSTKSIDKLKSQKIDGKNVKGGFLRVSAKQLSGDVLAVKASKPTSPYAVSRESKFANR